MTTLTIKSVKLSASGKAYNVGTDTGKYYVAGLATGIEQAEGKTIEAELGSFQSASGKRVETIDGFTLADTPKAPTANPSHSNGDRWWLPFVSNQCAHAIQAGLVKTEEELSNFAAAARRAILNADEDIPF